MKCLVSKNEIQFLYLLGPSKLHMYPHHQYAIFMTLSWHYGGRVAESREIRTSENKTLPDFSLILKLYEDYTDW